MAAEHSTPLSRRAILSRAVAAAPAVALTSLPAIASAASIPVLAGPDPALAVAARARAASAALTAVLDENDMVDDAPEQDEDDAAYFDMIHTVPTSLEGLAAVVAVMASEQRDFGAIDGSFRLPYFRQDDDAHAFINTLDEALRRLMGAASQLIEGAGLAPAFPIAE